MMLIIADKSSQKNFEFLVENTNKNYVFKSLLELAQLVCSCGYSEVYKPIKVRGALTPPGTASFVLT